ncbi:CDPK-related kinase 3-like [Silene latifolia]|uniref:CDPK-related kinase 3-like n=1 Tax=Silene latifolia TaxID=37657 RepID=UPI003D76AB3E
MGQCYGRPPAVAGEAVGGGNGEGEVHVHPQSPLPASEAAAAAAATRSVKNTPTRSTAASPYPQGVGVTPSPGRATPRRFFRRPFPPPSPAKHIRASIAKRLGTGKQKEGAIPEDDGGVAREVAPPSPQLDKSFGYARNFVAKYELGKEVGRGHFGHTCAAKAKKGEIKDQVVAVKIISKAKMTTAISIEDVRREVKMLKALSGHRHLVKFYDACEDSNNVYIVMELCDGGELLDRILSRGGKYTEEDAKAIIKQILNVVSFCHLQGVVGSF